MPGLRTKLLETAPAAVRKESLRIAAEGIRRGKLIAFPTETVYGLGANVYDERAVAKIFEVKGRPADNPFIVHVHSQRQAMLLAQEVPDYFLELANEFWPGPLTLIVRRNAAVPDVVTAGLPTVALRMPDMRLALDLIREAGVPIAAPSANLSGKPSPTDASTVFRDLKGSISGVLDGGNCQVGIESTVLDLTTKLPTILRPGTVTREDIEDVVQTRVNLARYTSERPLSPGMKYQHYAPHTPLFVLQHNYKNPEASIARRIGRLHGEGRRAGLLAPERYRDAGADAFVSLGDGSPVQYARGLYAGLRELDAAGIDIIFCPGITPDGIGLAVMNRLRKAATKVVRG